MQSATLNAYHAHTPRASDTFGPFDPRAYLREYYSHLGNENRALLHFLDEAYARIFTEISAARMLEFGGGPTIYQLISAAKYAVSIDFSEYLDANLNEVQLWLRDAQGQFFWDSFIHYVLDREGVHPHESITTEMAEGNVFVDHVAPLVRPQGYLLMCAIMGASYYRVGQLYFPAVPISPEMIKTKLKQQHFSIMLTHSIEAEHKDEQGYDGIFMVLARKEPV